MLRNEFLGHATPGGNPMSQQGGWHMRGARFFPKNAYDFFDLPRLFREFVVDGHAPAAPLLGASDRVLTLGSCFANHLRHILVETGFAADTIHVSAGLNNTFAMLDFVTWCASGQQSLRGFRYERGSDGRIADWHPPEERLMYRRHLAEAAAIVFVVGLAEVWEDVDTGGVFWRGVPSSIFAAERHRFRVSTVAENVANLIAMHTAVREINPAAEIVFALSPIPLNATYRPMSCITADSVSKAILRLALDEVVSRGLPRTWYWPSYEMVRSVGLHAPGAAFGDDGVVRHPSDHVVAEVVDCFVSCYYGEADYRRFREQRAARERRRGGAAAPDAYSVGNLIELADPYLGPRHRRLGWSFVDVGGVWTEGPRATLSFTLGEIDHDLAITLDGEAFLAPGHSENGLRLEVNGQQVGHFRFSGAIMERCTCRAMVPCELVNRAAGHLELALGIDAPCSPRALGLSPDSRELGFFARNLRLATADRALG